MKKALSELVALGIAGAGVMLLVGCIYFPGNYKRVDGRSRPETMNWKDGEREATVGGKRDAGAGGAGAGQGRRGGGELCADVDISLQDQHGIRL